MWFAGLTKLIDKFNHESCKDNFIEGYGDITGPSESDGVRVTLYKIWKYGYVDGECEVVLNE